MTILIADDNAQVRKTVRAMVEDLADGILECSSGPEAVASWEQNHPDWILMDIEMPGGDGITATTRIVHDSPSARIVIVSSHDSPKLRNAATAAGAHAYVVKGNLIELRSILAA
jgi:CheY-like chemotaxis protein